MKFFIISLIFILLLSCQKTRENKKLLDNLIFMEFSWVGNDSGKLVSPRVISYLEFKDSKIAKVARREYFEGDIEYKEVGLSDSIIAEFVNLLGEDMDSTYLFDPDIDNFLYCGNRYYLTYKLVKKDSNRVLFIPPKAPKKLKKLKLKIQALIESPNAQIVQKFPINTKFDEIIRDYGHMVEPPKVVTTKFLPPKIMENEQ